MKAKTKELCKLISKTIEKKFNDADLLEEYTKWLNNTIKQRKEIVATTGSSEDYAYLQALLRAKDKLESMGKNE